MNKDFGFRFSSSTFSDVGDSFLSVYLFSIKEKINRGALLFCENPEVARRVYDVVSFSFPGFVCYYPGVDSNRVGGFVGENQRYREEALHRVFCDDVRGLIVVTSRSVANIVDIEKKTKSLLLDLSVGLEIEKDSLVSFLLDWGYVSVYAVGSPGEYSIRGNIIDFFPAYLSNPIRVEFDFTAIRSLRFFNQSTQLTVSVFDNISISPPQKSVVCFDDKQSFVGLFSAGVVLDYSSINRHLTFLNYKSKAKALSVDSVDVFIKKLSPVAKKEALLLLVKKFTPKNVYYFGEDLRPVSPYLNLTDFIHIKKPLFSGFYSLSLGLCCLSESDFVVMNKRPRWFVNQKINQGDGLVDLSGLEEGDFLVYAPFGVCIYRGLSFFNNNKQESLELEFANNVRVSVSLDKMTLVHRYLATNKAPTLSIVGGKKWSTDVLKTKKSVEVVAKELLRLYSSKKTGRGFVYDPPNEFYNSLVDSFPFLETKDQSRAISDVLVDMAKEEPMDRFICGDVGFGKTEVALRAIMLAVLSGKRAMFLCPTTLLADQHYISCFERFEPLGVSVELLSRFKTKKEQVGILERALRGKIDVLIGTHRLLSGDVYLPDLSLLIVDEEHRFGVRHKEKIRFIKEGVDLLSLSATPIPRTLQHALSGVKEISKILTPPVARQPISTDIKYFDMGVIFERIDRELSRGGQVYFLNNSIDGIPYYYEKIKHRFSKNVVAFIHGRQDAKTLEKTILAFFSGGIDVLICTTIIESGLDVSNANCIIINDAQNFGLSQLYQIRGRVGRGHRKANCLLLIPRKQLDSNAHKRLKTIEQHTSLGSGYEISLKDLEIRGAGALFGYKQSGHISSVGFQLYCDLLKDAVGGGVSSVAFPSMLYDGELLIPKDYIQEEGVRLYYYDRLSRARLVGVVDRIRDELKDRFGGPPKEVGVLLDITKNKILLGGDIVSVVSIKSSALEFVLTGLGALETVNDLVVLFYSVVGSRYGEIKLSEKRNGNLGVVVPCRSTWEALALLNRSVPLLLSGFYG